LIMNLENGSSKQSSISFSLEQDFRLRYAHHMIPIRDDNGKLKMEPIVQHWVRWPKRHEFSGIVFNPKSTPIGYYNLFKGFPVTPRKGDWSLFKQHIYEVITKSTNDIYTWVLGWMARIVQDPGGDRPGTSLVLRGPQGAGKGALRTTSADSSGTISSRSLVRIILLVASTSISARVSWPFWTRDSGQET